jgi:GNAT superfamily N-acetyltransferase
MKIREVKTSWGIRYYYDEEHYRFALYYYDDDPKTAYLANVEADPKYRGNGLGNTILSEAKKYAKKHGANMMFLKCLKTSWVHDWYKRHGYKHHSVDKDDDRYVWLKQRI